MGLNPPPLRRGADYRTAPYRPEIFQRFYAFHLKYRAHPGAVYYVMPYLRNALGWGPEEALWYAFINGNTQNPVTSLLLHRAAPTPAHAPALLDFWRANYPRLAFDTDRRYHKKALDVAVAGYLAALRGAPQEAFWGSAAAGGFAEMWATAGQIPTFGRLSTFSYLEYLRIMGVPFDCDTLLLGDRAGSRSHRNGLCLVTGRDGLDWHASNPSFNGIYPPRLIEALAADGADILAEARRRAAGTGYEYDVSYFTLESALCTYKSWHRPNRRYPNVYNDLLHDRLRAAGRTWPEADLSLLWEARADTLPAHLRLESTPTDPGCVPVKQNHYRRTGQVIMMDREDPALGNDFNDAVNAGLYGQRAA